MRKYVIIILTCLLGLFVTSCSDFLDKTPYTQIPTEGTISNAITAEYAILGVYDRMQYTDGYGRAAIVIPDAATANNTLSASNSNRYIAVTQWTTNRSSGEQSALWYRFYAFINAANRILDVIDDIDATDSEIQQLKAEALCQRAIGHFILVNIFAQAYPGGESSLGVPYMLKSHVYDKPSRDNVQTVYDYLITDLTDAISLFTSGGNPSDNAPYRFDIWSAKALLAKVYMYQLNYPAAKPILKDIVDNSGYGLLTNADYESAWGKRYDNAAKTEFMFAIANNSTDYQNTGSLGYIYLKGGYGDLRASNDLTALYSTSDVRRSAFFMFDGTGPADTYVNKYPNRDGMNGLSDNPIMRLSDVYLLYAEACAYTNDEPTAITYLDEIRQRAEPTVAVSTETGDALKDKIFLERRKELAFEGQFLFDLKRQQKPIPAGFRSDGVQYATIPYPSEKRAFPISDVELDANPNMVQNPGY